MGACRNHNGVVTYALGLCRACYDRERRNTPSVRAHLKRWRAENRRRNGPARRAQASKYYLSTKESAKMRFRRATLGRYGLSVQDYDRLLDQQGGGCAICGKTRGGDKREVLCVDHCHNTGRVRGLLCVRCNLTVGFLDDAAFADAVMRYLGR